MADDLIPLGTDSARGPDGKWRVNRRLLVIVALLIIATAVAVFPLRLLPAPWWADTVLHFGWGIALALGAAAAIPRRDDALAAAVAVAGVAFEPGEWAYFACELRPVLVPPECQPITLAEWMMQNDTIKDMGFVALGAVAALIVVGRYR